MKNDGWRKCESSLKKRKEMDDVLKLSEKSCWKLLPLDSEFFPDERSTRIPKVSVLLP